MRKVVLTLGIVVGVIALGVGIVGLVVTPNDHVVPVPYRIVTYGAVAMMGSLTILVIAFAHGTRAGALD